MSMLKSLPLFLFIVFPIVSAMAEETENSASQTAQAYLKQAQTGAQAIYQQYQDTKRDLNYTPAFMPRNVVSAADQVPTSLSFAVSKGENNSGQCIDVLTNKSAVLATSDWLLAKAKGLKGRLTADVNQWEERENNRYESPYIDLIKGAYEVERNYQAFRLAQYQILEKKKEQQARDLRRLFKLLQMKSQTADFPITLNDKARVMLLKTDKKDGEVLFGDINIEKLNLEQLHYLRKIALKAYLSSTLLTTMFFETRNSGFNEDALLGKMMDIGLFSADFIKWNEQSQYPELKDDEFLNFRPGMKEFFSASLQKFMSLRGLKYGEYYNNGDFLYIPTMDEDKTLVFGNQFCLDYIRSHAKNKVFADVHQSGIFPRASLQIVDRKTEYDANYCRTLVRRIQNLNSVDSPICAQIKESRGLVHQMGTCKSAQQNGTIDRLTLSQKILLLAMDKEKNPKHPMASKMVAHYRDLQGSAEQYDQRIADVTDRRQTEKKIFPNWRNRYYDDRLEKLQAKKEQAQAELASIQQDSKNPARHIVLLAKDLEKPQSKKDANPTWKSARSNYRALASDSSLVKGHFARLAQNNEMSAQRALGQHYAERASAEIEKAKKNETIKLPLERDESGYLRHASGTAIAGGVEVAVFVQGENVYFYKKSLGQTNWVTVNTADNSNVHFKYDGNGKLASATTTVNGHEVSYIIYDQEMASPVLFSAQ